MRKPSDFDYNELLKLIEKIVEKKVNNIFDNLGVEASTYGEITSLDTTTTDESGNTTKVERASVKLPDGSFVHNLFNASGENLKLGDKVKVYGSRQNMSNRYIGIKYNKEEENA